jgi:hypothetical protein
MAHNVYKVIISAAEIFADTFTRVDFILSSGTEAHHLKFVFPAVFAFGQKLAQYAIRWIEKSGKPSGEEENTDSQTTESLTTKFDAIIEVPP